MFETHQNGANEKPDKSPKKHPVSETGRRSRAAQDPLSQDSGANIVEGVGPIDVFGVWPATSPKSHTPPYAPRKHCARYQCQHVKKIPGRVVQITEDFA